MNADEISFWHCLALARRPWVWRHKRKKEDLGHHTSAVSRPQPFDVCRRVHHDSGDMDLMRFVSKRPVSEKLRYAAEAWDRVPREWARHIKAWLS